MTMSEALPPTSGVTANPPNAAVGRSTRGAGIDGALRDPSPEGCCLRSSGRSDFSLAQERS